jgi:hypothetical protein
VKNLAINLFIAVKEIRVNYELLYGFEASWHCMYNLGKWGTNPTTFEFSTSTTPALWMKG